MQQCKGQPHGIFSRLSLILVHAYEERRAKTSRLPSLTSFWISVIMKWTLENKTGSAIRLKHYIKNMKLKTKRCVLALSVAMLLGGCAKEQEDTNLSEGMAHLEQYEYQAALECFDAATLYNEDRQLVLRGEGLAYMGLGDYAQAETMFLASIACSSGHLTELEYDTNFYLAAAYMKQEKYADAEQIYSAIIALRKKDVDAHYLRACTFLRRGDYEAALADFEKAFSLDPENIALVTDAYVEMQAAGFADEGRIYLESFMQSHEGKLTDRDRGAICYYLGDYENARIWLDGLLNGNDAGISLLLGQTYEQLGDRNYAAVVYQTYLDANAPDAAIYNSLGICLMRQGKYTEALEAFEAGIAMGNTDYLQNLKFNLIVANENLGNFAQAKTLMQEYVQIYPEDAKAAREYEFLSTR